MDVEQFHDSLILNSSILILMKFPSLNENIQVVTESLQCPGVCFNNSENARYL